MGADLGGEHQLVSKSLQVDTEDLRADTEVIRGGCGGFCVTYRISINTLIAISSNTFQSAFNLIFFF